MNAETCIQLCTNAYDDACSKIYEQRVVKRRQRATRPASRLYTARQTTIKFTVAVGVCSTPALIVDISTALLRRRPTSQPRKYLLRPSQRNLICINSVGWWLPLCTKTVGVSGSFCRINVSDTLTRHVLCKLTTVGLKQGRNHKFISEGVFSPVPSLLFLFPPFLPFPYFYPAYVAH